MFTIFFPYKSMRFFPDAQRLLTLIWPNIKLDRDFMVVLVTCKNEEHPIKNEGANVFKTLYINFSDAQGQITQESVVVSGRISNSFKLSSIFSSPARMKMIQFKNEEPRVVTTFFPL